MNEPHIPAHAQTLRLAAAQEAARATQWAGRETDLSQRYTQHQTWAEGERARIQAELEQARAKAKAQLDALDATGKTLATDLAEAGRRKDQHATDGQDAQTSWLEWCTRHGIDPKTLPPVPVADTGPLPAVPAEQCDECESTGRNCAAHGGRPGSLRQHLLIEQYGSTDSGPHLVPDEAYAPLGDPTQTVTDPPAGRTPFRGTDQSADQPMVDPPSPDPAGVKALTDLDRRGEPDGDPHA
jgi:hypothetical protein